MSRLRWGTAALAGTALARLRWGNAAIAGTPVIIPRTRWGKALLDGVAAVLVVPLPPQTAEPGTIVTLTAALVDGQPADTWLWRRISGPTIGITGTGPTIGFTAPSAMPPGATLAIGVRATKDGTTSPEQTVTITVLPQLRWIHTPPAGWAPATPMVLT